MDVFCICRSFINDLVEIRFKFRNTVFPGLNFLQLTGGIAGNTQYRKANEFEKPTQGSGH